MHKNIRAARQMEARVYAIRGMECGWWFFQRGERRGCPVENGSCGLTGEMRLGNLTLKLT